MKAIQKRICSEFQHVSFVIKVAAFLYFKFLLFFAQFWNIWTGFWVFNKAKLWGFTLNELRVFVWTKSVHNARTKSVRKHQIVTILNIIVRSNPNILGNRFLGSIKARKSYISCRGSFYSETNLFSFVFECRMQTCKNSTSLNQIQMTFVITDGWMTSRITSLLMRFCGEELTD